MVSDKMAEHIREVRKANLEREETTNYYKGDYGRILSIVGLILGGWLGYLLRPSINAFGINAQLPFSKIVEALVDMKVNPIEQVYAQTSIEYIITGLIFGAVIGWVVGKFIKK